MYDVLELAKVALPYIVPATAALSLSGLVPRIGPGRAIWIAFRSRFAFSKMPVSVRDVEVKQIKEEISNKNFGQSYLIITGDKGIGKSCLLSTATNRTCGIVNVEVQPGESENNIIKASLQNLVNLPFEFVPHRYSARRVIFWYYLLSFGNTPTIIINATERKTGQEYASLTGAVRTLVDKFKLRVIIDGSPNSLDDSLFRTERAEAIEIKPMTKEMIWSLPQLKEFISVIDTNNLGDVVWLVLGGIPARFERVQKKFEKIKSSMDAKELIGELLCNEIYSAIKIVDLAQETNSNMKEIIKLFDKEINGIIRKSLIDKGLIRPTPDKVFHEMKINGVSTLVPCSNAIGIVLRNDLTKEPTMEDLKKIALASAGKHYFSN
eukprot:gene22069-28567_t